MKFSTVIVALAASFASAAPTNESLDKRGGGPVCLAVCAPLAPIWGPYAACLSACLAAGVEDGPVEAEDFVKTYLEEAPATV
nr:precursor peptide [Acaulium album]